MTARLTFISHAATEAQRHSAFPLDEPVLEREAVRLASLKWNPPRVERVLSAPEARTRETSRRLGLRFEIAEELRDCNYGSWAGRTMDEVHSESPGAVVAWLTDPGVFPHGGESITALISRVGSWLSRQQDGGPMLAVTHPAIIRAAILHSLGLPAALFWRFDIAPLTMTDLRYSRSVWTVRAVGCPVGAASRGESPDASI